MMVRNKLFLACESFLRVPPLLVIDEIFRTSFGFGGRPFKYGIYESPNSIRTDTVILNSKDPSNPLDLGGLSDLIEPSNVQNGNNTTKGSSIATATAEYIDSWIAKGLDVVNNAVNPSNGTDKSEGEGGYKFPEEFTEDLIFVAQILLTVALFFAAVVMFMLATDNLIKLYSYLVSLLTLYLAFVAPPLIFSTNLNDLFLTSLNLTSRTFLAGVFFASKSWPTAHMPPGYSWTYLLDPVIPLSLFILTGVMNIPTTVFVITIAILQIPIILSLPKVYHFLMVSWGETKRVQNEYGLSHLIQVESGRLRVNTVFRLFWMTRAAYDGFYRCCDEPLSLIIRYIMVHGTETFTGIVGLTVTVAAICHQIGDCLLYLLYCGANNEVDLNRFGSISTVLFFILSLQSGLTSLDPEKRLDRLLKNIALLGTALFHALHQLVAPLLHAFRSFQAVQIRAATISVTFLCLSAMLTFSLLRWTTISTWSLAVLALAVEFKIKVVISLIISLVVWLSNAVQYPDSLERVVSFFRRVLPHSVMHFFVQLHDQISHEDMVFYLKTVANVAEFITGIFLFLNAVWIFIFESTSAIRAIGMSVHAYFNIWCEAQKGFRIYSQRKTASKKIMSLNDATEDQLRYRNDDVCSICYESFESAKVTNCGHLFHAVCLRKWLYVQNTCPMCHEILYKEDATEGVVGEAPVQQPVPRQNRDVPDRNLNLNNGNEVDGEAVNNIHNNNQSPHHNHAPVAAEENELWDDIDDGADTDSDLSNHLHEAEEDDSDSFVEVEDLEVWNDRGDREGRGGGGGEEGGIQAANGRGLVLFL